MPGEKQWLEDRKKHITGTDIAKILGVSPFGDPLSVYMDKIGLSEPTEPSRRMIAGQRYQTAILEDYALETGHRLTHADPFELVVHAGGILGASLDAYDITLGNAPVDAKNTACAYEKDGWGETGTDAIPEYYRLQLAAQMAVSGASLSRLAVLVGGWDLRIYQVDRDPELEGMLLESAAKFWRDHVVARKPPEIVGSVAAKEYLAKTYPSHHVGLSVQAEEGDEPWADYLAKAMADEEDAKKRKEEAQVWLKQRIGNAEGIWSGNGWKATWKNSKGTEKIDWEKVAREAGASPALISRFTETIPGSRRFLFKGAK